MGCLNLTIHAGLRFEVGRFNDQGAGETAFLACLCYNNSSFYYILVNKILDTNARNNSKSFEEEQMNTVIVLLIKDLK